MTHPVALLTLQRFLQRHPALRMATIEVTDNRITGRYDVGTDRLLLMRQEAYPDEGAYFHSVFHELIHATGHPTRLNRPHLARSATNFDFTAANRRDQLVAISDMSVEEIVAELGSFTLLQECEVPIPATRWHEVECYLSHYLEAFEKTGHAAVLGLATAEAIRAVTYVLNRDVCYPPRVVPLD